MSTSASSLNFGNISIDANGRVSFSGLSSGIDAQKAVDAIIAAKQVPIDTIKKTVTDNQTKITDLNSLKSQLTSLQNALAQLYGAVTVDSSTNAFAMKQATTSTSRADGVTPSAASNLLGVAVTNAAVVGSHTIEILRTAASQKVASDKFTSTTTALGLNSGDTFTINGSTITVSSTDTLQDVRDKINGADTGATPSGVTASIVTVSATENYLVLTSDATGQTMSLANGTGTPLTTLGILDGSNAVKHQLQAAATAQFYADGILDQTNTSYESAVQSAATTPIGSAGQLTFKLSSNSSTIGTINYTAGETLQQLATAITSGVTGVTASVVQDGNAVRLNISGASAFTFSETGAGTAIPDLGINNHRLAIQRTSNTITDLFAGTTLNLSAAEQGTTIKIAVQPDLTTIKTDITAFVTAYNSLKQFINKENATDPSTGVKSSTAGPLFGDNVLSAVQDTLGNIIGSGAIGVNSAFQVLSQIGITFVDNSTLSDPTLNNTLQVDDATLNSKLVSNLDDVRRMFTFDFSSSDPRVHLLAFNGSTTYNSSGYTLNIQPNSGSNLLQHSEEADNAYWTPTAATVNANAIAAPDGNMTADALVADATAGPHTIANTAPETVTAGQSYVFSTYVKAGAADGIRVALTGANFAANAYADFNLTTGTLIGNGAGAAGSTIESVGNGWYRVSVRATATGSGAATFERDALSGGSNSFAGNGTTASTYLWGSQLEQGSAGPGGYIKTTTSTLTGVVATANINGTADGANDGSATVANGQVTVNTGGATGLQLFASGITLPTSATLNFTVGMGAQMYFQLGDMLDSVTGNIATEIGSLNDQNTLANTRVTEMTGRLDYQRTQLLDRFTAMETAIAKAKNIMDTLTQQTNALNPTSSSGG